MGRKQPLISVIIVTLNNSEWLLKCIDALYKQTYASLEIIVVDNGSRKSPMRLLAKHFPKVVFMQNTKNVGYGRATNRGIQKAKGDYFLLYNDDAICDVHFLSILYKGIKNDSQLGAVQGTLLSYDHPDIVESIGSYLTPTGILWKETGFAYSSRKLQSHYIFNANLPLIRRDVLEKIGLFDEDYFLYFEEVDLCWRIWEGGYKIMSFPAAKVWHKSGATTKKLNHAFVIESTYRNRLNSLVKNLEFRNMLFILPLHTIFCSFGIISFLLLGKLSLAGAIFKAFWSTIKDFKHIYHKHVATQKIRVASDKEIFRYCLRQMKFSYLLKIGLPYFFSW